MECHARPTSGARRRCATCLLRRAPIGDQVAAARARLALVPEELQKKRVHPSAWPPGTRWCAGCQSFRDLADFGKGATRCRPCASASAHAANIEKTYGLTAAEYDALLELQGGRCAICRRAPKSKRLAVDHSHSGGEVRGLLCGPCNHDLLGAGFDSLPKLEAAAFYLHRPPAAGAWAPPEAGLVVEYAAAGDRPAAAATARVRDDLVGAEDLGGPARPGATPPPVPLVAAPRVPAWHASMTAEESARYWGYLHALVEAGPRPPF
jgi:hypothetical protein